MHGLLREAPEGLGSQDGLDDAGPRAYYGAALGPHAVEVSEMTWEAPAFSEVKMDAEINSYQDDFDREQDDRF